MSSLTQAFSVTNRSSSPRRVCTNALQRGPSSRSGTSTSSKFRKRGARTSSIMRADSAALNGFRAFLRFELPNPIRTCDERSQSVTRSASCPRCTGFQRQTSPVRFILSRKAKEPASFSPFRVPRRRKPGKILGLEAALGNERRLGLRLAVASVTIALWLVSVFYHEEGGKLFAAYFKYGTTHWGGGTLDVPSPAGRAIAEKLIFSIALV